MHIARKIDCLEVANTLQELRNFGYKQLEMTLRHLIITDKIALERTKWKREIRVGIPINWNQNLMMMMVEHLSYFR